ncbi:DUF4132 domain-containing protein [Actinomadura sp. 21ATH]|uniref:DUF4132 domain-containing protein n=1 Tax=Actinomadura sp. 21ATH TaxID=1735444 RepID=UPI0035BF35B5
MDEDAFDPPKRWRRRSLHARRGGLEVPVTVPAAVPEALRAAREHAAPWLDGVLGHPDSDPAPAARARRHLAGEDEPLGAAAVATCLIWFRFDGWTHDHGGRHDDVFDGLIVEHGLPTAVCAALEMPRLHLRWPPARKPEMGGPPSIGLVPASAVHHAWWYGHHVLRRLRDLLAAADDRDYRETEERLAALRRTPEERARVSYLLPTRTDWVDECCAAPPADQWYIWQILCSLTGLSQLDRLGAVADLAWNGHHPGVLATMAEGIGPAVAPVVAEFADGDRVRAAARRDALKLLGMLPTDEAFGLLVERLGQKDVEPVVSAAAERFPVRALRVLGAAAAGRGKAAAAAAGLLRSHAATRPDLVAAELPGLPAASRAAVEEALRSPARLPDAPASAVPRVLAEPPWTRARRKARPPVIADLVPALAPSVVWLAGERERWSASAEPFRHVAEEGSDWAKAAADHRAGRRHIHPAAMVFGPEEVMRPIAADWRPPARWGAETWLPRLAARFELDVLPLLLRSAHARPMRHDPLLPFRDARVALVMAARLARFRAVRPVAVEWFARHRLAAAVLLVPAALGEPGRTRGDAESALLHLAGTLGADEVAGAARVYGPEAAAAVETLLETDPLELVPARVPKPPAWADPALLPQIALRGGGRALPAAATGHLVTMLAMSGPGEWYAGIGAAEEACDRASLAAFSWELFERWQAAGAPPRDGWALAQLGRLGDDEAARRLVPLIRAWPLRSGHKKAAAGVDALAGIGTDLALTHLDGIARKVRFAKVRARAQERIREVAGLRGLSPEQLADRLVPDLGLDAAGSLALDYGPRRFTVGFDERLRPYVLDGDGRRRKSLPRPGAKDDAALADAAYKRFAALKKDARAVAADQIVRLEQAMVGRRTWPAADFRRLFADHPLVRHIARRLVWQYAPGGFGETDGAGGSATAFRIAEDGTFADVNDDALALPDSAAVRIPHPLHLGDEPAAWAELFADYEILQPFPQIARGVYEPAAEERAGHLARFEGVSVPAGRILAMKRRGWEPEAPQDAGVQMSISRALPGGGSVGIALSPGLVVGNPGFSDEHTLESVRFTGAGDLHPVDASEMLADLAEVTGQEG